MRVLFNTFPVAFDCPGGGEIQLLKSREALGRAGIEVVLFNPWQPQLDQVDAVHYFSVQGGSMNFCAYVKHKGLPLLISPVLWLTEENQQCMPLQEIRDLLHLCDLVLPNSRAEQEQLASFFGLHRDKFAVTYNGIDAAFARKVDGDIFRTRFGITRPFLLNVANVEPRKNQLRLIDALQGLGMDLVILGHVRDQHYFQSCLQAGQGFVHYLGYLDHEGDLLKAAYQECTLFVLPSMLETPGLAALEAAALGKKVVVTEVGSTREYFADLVTYVDPGQVEDIRRGILTEMHQKRDHRLQERINTQFTWDQTAQELIKAYDAARQFSQQKRPGRPAA